MLSDERIAKIRAKLIPHHETHDPDAEFYRVPTREDIADLLADNEALRARLAAVEAERDDLRDGQEALITQLEAKDAQLEEAAPETAARLFAAGLRIGQQAKQLAEAAPIIVAVDSMHLFTFRMRHEMFGDVREAVFDAERTNFILLRELARAYLAAHPVDVTADTEPQVVVDDAED